MSPYQKTVPLRSGVTVTVQAWAFADMAARSAEFMGMLESFTARIKGEVTDLPDVDALRLMERTVRFSLHRPEDHELLRACDLPDLVEAIWEVNGLGDLVGKFLRLRLAAHQRQEAALSSPPPGT
ncbi:hypothetical protein [Deinococcus depolymerans]|uniref:Uncharacterized protein n=1 Tax=Deinococcus depolymerans TaxID=392408 RepID=A0ABP3LWV5_9DEIO